LAVVTVAGAVAFGSVVFVVEGVWACRAPVTRARPTKATESFMPPT
jgi:hypothetical protein